VNADCMSQAETLLDRVLSSIDHALAEAPDEDRGVMETFSTTMRGLQIGLNILELTHWEDVPEQTLLYKSRACFISHYNTTSRKILTVFQHPVIQRLIGEI